LVSSPFTAEFGSSINRTIGTPGNLPTDASRAILHECFAMFHASAVAVARLSIETSNDLFEMDSFITAETIFEFKSRRKDWVRKFDEALRQFFENRVAGARRRRRRPDAEESLGSLRVLSDADTRKQAALRDTTRTLFAAAKEELDALDYRISVLFGEPPSLETDNPFSPAYLLDAIGMTSRALYVEPQIWRSVMARVVMDFVPAINNIYIPLNRLLAQRGVLPEIAAVLRARSGLYPDDDGEVLPLFQRLINDVHPSLQAWRTLDVRAAAAATYRLAPLEANPYAAALARERPDEEVAATTSDRFPKLDAMMSCGKLYPVLATLDQWQRADPMTEVLQTPATGDAGSDGTPVNRIPWIHAALAPQVPDERDRVIIDAVGFLFDYFLRDNAIPPRFRLIFDGLQVVVLKAALADPALFATRWHPARRLINDLAKAAIGAEDDATYNASATKIASQIVDGIRAEFRIDNAVFERACRRLAEFTDRERELVSRTMQPHIEAATLEESVDTDRSQVRALIRNKMAGADVPIAIRSFADMVWANYLTQIRRTEGSDSASFSAAVETLDNLLWSIAVKPRTGQKSRLSKMIPLLVRNLRSGGAAVEVSDEKIQRFLDTLYELHIAAIKPQATPGTAGSGTSIATGSSSASGPPQSRNVYDLVVDVVSGTWFSFDRGGGRWVHARLGWISPTRSSYIFAGRAGSEIITRSPEELAAEMGLCKASLVAEPVPLFDRAVSAALEYLAARRTVRDGASSGGAPLH